MNQTIFPKGMPTNTHFLLSTPLVPFFVVCSTVQQPHHTMKKPPYVVLVTTQNPKTIKWWIWFRLRRRLLLLSRSSQTHKEEEKQRVVQLYSLSGGRWPWLDHLSCPGCCWRFAANWGSTACCPQKHYIMCVFNGYSLSLLETNVLIGNVLKPPLGSTVCCLQKHYNITIRLLFIFVF